MRAQKQIRLNALDMNCCGGTPGLWLHPDDRTDRYNTLAYWTELAQLLERGMFDSLFIADIFGVYDVYGGTPMPRSATPWSSPSTTRSCWCPPWRW